MSDEQHVCRNRDLKIVAAPLEDLIYSLRTIIYGMHDCYFEQKFVKAVEKFSDLCVCASDGTHECDCARVHDISCRFPSTSDVYNKFYLWKGAYNRSCCLVRGF